MKIVNKKKWTRPEVLSDFWKCGPFLLIIFARILQKAYTIFFFKLFNVIFFNVGLFTYEVSHPNGGGGNFFKTEDNLAIHDTTNHNKCHICGKIFKNNIILTQHFISQTVKTIIPMVFYRPFSPVHFLVLIYIVFS